VALIHGISSLKPEDYFSIIGFSEHQYFYSPNLVPVFFFLLSFKNVFFCFIIFLIIIIYLKKATPANVESAITWIENITAGGLTDILTPLTVFLLISLDFL